MSAEPKSSIKVMEDSASPKSPEHHFSRPQPSGVIPAELLSDRYRATDRQSHEATEQISSGGGEGAVSVFLPNSKEKHASAWEGSGNCLWRLCRRIRAMGEQLANQAALEAESVFELWYAAYREWCKRVGVSAEPKSRLHGEFLTALEKCKLAEGETLVAYAFNRARELPFPAETAPFDDDQGMCLLTSTLRECALFRDEGGLCYASTRDIEKYTQLCNKDTAARWLKQLEKRNILLRIYDGVVSATYGVAPRFIYLPLVEVEKMSPETRKLYEGALAERSRQAAPTKTRTDLI